MRLFSYLQEGENLMVFFEEEIVVLLAGILGDTERMSRP
jgi:hypothetical protein